MSSQHIRIGGWTAFSEARGMNKKEEPENFDWMKKDDAFWYTDLRAALDVTPGSREFLRCLKPEDPSRGPIIDAVQDKVSGYHSGSSLSSLFSCYRAALNDWDSWVLDTKRRQILDDYRKLQIDFNQLIIFYNNLVHSNLVVKDDEDFRRAMEKCRVVFVDESDSPVELSWESGDPLNIVQAILAEHRAFKTEEDGRQRKKRMKERIEYLEWNLEHPSRWFWSHDQHPTYSITAEELAEMERLHPGYRDHIARVCTHIGSLGWRAGTVWSVENAEKLDARLRHLGIISA